MKNDPERLKKELSMNNEGVSRSNIPNGLAIAALVLGILSVVTIIFAGFGIILGIIGLMLGIIGLKKIGRVEQEGKKVAVAGIICSSLGILLPILLMVISYMAYTKNVSS